MTAVIIVAAVLGVCVILGGVLWLCAVAVDKGIKDYIDYAKKGKGDGSS